MLPPVLVSSYLTFSPLPTPEREGGYFLFYYYGLSTIFPLGSMILYVARTFLSSALHEAAIEQSAAANIGKCFTQRRKDAGKNKGRGKKKKRITQRRKDAGKK